MPFLSFNLAFPLPPTLSPQQVVEALHRYEPLITPNPFLVSYRRRPVDLSEIVDDAFFREDGQALAAFEVVDRIVLVPGLATKQVVIPCVMQRFDGGLRCRSLAAGGVRVWSTWRVLPAASAAEESSDGGGGQRGQRGQRSHSRSWSRNRDRGQGREKSETSAAVGPLTPPATPPRRDGETTTTVTAAGTTTPAAYELVEEALVECSSLVKPFVGRSFQSAHMEILRTVVREIMQQQQQQQQQA